MANLLIDPGFELNDPAWVFSSAVGPDWTAERSQVEANTGVWSARVRGNGNVPTSQWGYVQQTIPAHAGDPISFYLNADHRSRFSLLSFQYEDPIIGFTELAVLSGVVGDDFGPGWFLWNVGSMPGGLGTTVRIRVQTRGTDPSGVWYIDDGLVGALSVEERVARHRHLIIAEMVAVLKTITGNNVYWNDIGGRVYLRGRAPGSEVSEGEIPVLFVLEPPERSDFRNDDHGLKSQVHLHIVGVVRETSTDPLVSNASAAASKLRDDVVKCLLTNLKLNGRATAPIMFRDELFDVGLDDTYGSFGLSVTVPYHIFAADLGPGAI